MVTDNFAGRRLHFLSSVCIDRVSTKSYIQRSIRVCVW